MDLDDFMHTLGDVMHGLGGLLDQNHNGHLDWGDVGAGLQNFSTPIGNLLDQNHNGHLDWGDVGAGIDNLLTVTSDPGLINDIKRLLDRNGNDRLDPEDVTHDAVFWVTHHFSPKQMKMLFKLFKRFQYGNRSSGNYSSSNRSSGNYSSDNYSSDNYSSDDDYSPDDMSDFFSFLRNLAKKGVAVRDAKGIFYVLP